MTVAAFLKQARAELPDEPTLVQGGALVFGVFVLLAAIVGVVS